MWQMFTLLHDRLVGNDHIFFFLKCPVITKFLSLAELKNVNQRDTHLARIGKYCRDTVKMDVIKKSPIIQPLQSNIINILM